MYIMFNTENMQARIDMLEAKQGAVSSASQSSASKCQEIESTFINVQTKYETDLLVFSKNLTRLEGDSVSHRSTIEDHNSRLTNFDTRITQLESDNAKNVNLFQHLDAATEQIETAMTDCQGNIQIINYTMEALSRGIYANEDRIAMEHMKIEQLQLERSVDRVVIQNLNESITQLKLDGILDHVAMHKINTSVTNLDLEGAMFWADIGTLNTSMNRLHQNSAKHQTDIQNLCTKHFQTGDNWINGPNIYRNTH